MKDLRSSLTSGRPAAGELVHVNRSRWGSRAQLSELPVDLSVRILVLALIVSIPSWLVEESTRRRGALGLGAAAVAPSRFLTRFLKLISGEPSLPLS